MTVYYKNYPGILHFSRIIGKSRLFQGRIVQLEKYLGVYVDELDKAADFSKELSNKKNVLEYTLTDWIK